MSELVVDDGDGDDLFRIDFAEDGHTQQRLGGIRLKIDIYVYSISFVLSISLPI